MAASTSESPFAAEEHLRQFVERQGGWAMQIRLPQRGQCLGMKLLRQLFSVFAAVCLSQQLRGAVDVGC
jgi:hypothetical protein